MENVESDLKVIGGRRGQLILVGDNLITTKKSNSEPAIILGKNYNSKPKSKRITIPKNNSNSHNLDDEEHDVHSPKMKSKHRKIGNHQVNSTENMTKIEIKSEEAITKTKVKVTINENRVYLIKIPIIPENLTLADLKKNMPKKGPFKFFVKTILEDGDTGFEEYDDDNAILPLFEDKIIVECNTI